MNYKINNKTIRIPDTDIERSMRILKLTKDEAIRVWLEDEGYLVNEEQEALERKAKANKITATIHQASSKSVIEKKKEKTQKERCKKENPTKEMIIAEVAKLLPNFATDIEVLNPGKLISFTIGDDKFEIDLKQKRKSKK